MLEPAAFKLFVTKAVKSKRLGEEVLQESHESILTKLQLFEGTHLKRAASLLFHDNPEELPIAKLKSKHPSIPFNPLIAAAFFRAGYIETREKVSEKIIELIEANNFITISELAEFLGVTTRTIERKIKKLQTENKIRRVGSDKTGHWILS